MEVGILEKLYEVAVESKWSAKINDVTLGEDENAEERTIVLDPNNNVDQQITRRIVRATIVDPFPRAGNQKRVDIRIVAQKRHKNGEPWRDANDFTLTRLHGGEEARILLDANQTFELLETLQDLYAISKGGEPSGQKRAYVVRRDNQPAPISVQEIRKFLANGGEAVWEQVVGLGDKIPLAAALHKIHDVRTRAVEEFEQHIATNDWAEGDWQKFFQTNTWIFGSGLAYQFLDTVQAQPHYGGTTVTGRGGQRGDFLMATRAEVKFTVLVEIKRPDTPLLKPISSDEKPYRDKVYAASEELAGGVAQIQSNCRTWVTEGSRSPESREWFGDDVHTYEPKAIFVIGNTAELNEGSREQPAMHKRASFELFRRNLRTPEIVTFDELLERARFVVATERETDLEPHSSAEDEQSENMGWAE